MDLTTEALSVILTGDYSHSDFGGLLDPRPTGWIAMDPNALMLDASLARQSIDLIIVAQSRPGQYSTSQIAQIQNRFPSTPLLGLLGSWCEGESRSGQPWDAADRIYWHKWLPEYEQFLGQMRRAGASAWHLPATMTTADKLLYEYTREESTAGPSTAALISATSRSGFELVADACQAVNFSASWLQLRPGTSVPSTAVPPSVLVINSDGGARGADAEVQKIAALGITDLPVVVVVGFARRHDVARWTRTAGVRAVVSKPFAIFELEKALLDSVSNWTNRVDQVA